MLAELRKLPTETIAYWAPPALLAAYEKYPALEPTYGEVRVGLQTGDDERFLRYWWEVPEECIGEGRRWVPFAKGGEYSPYYESLLRVIDWQDNGNEVRRFKGAVVRNPSYYFREGITYPRIADRFHAKVLPVGSIFADKGPGIFGPLTYPLLGFLNSRVAQVLLMAQSVTRQFEVGQVRRLCVPQLGGELGQKLGAIAQQAVAEAERYAEGDELDRRFVRSWIDEQPQRSLTAASESVLQWHSEVMAERSRRQATATNIAAGMTGFQTSDWGQIDQTFGRDIGEDKRLRVRDFRKKEVDDLLQRRDEHVERYVSSLIGGILRASKLVEFGQLQRLVGDAFTKRFSDGDPVNEFAKIVGKPLSEWLGCDYQLYHLQRHAGRPFILVLTGPNRALLLFVDVLRSESADLRRAVADVLEPIAREAQAAVSAGKRSDIAVRNQRLLEDSQFIAKALGEATNGWDTYRDDVRPRVAMLRPLAPYLNEKESRRGYAG